MDKSCLIVGGDGFIGRNLTEFLLKEGYTIRIYDLIQSEPDQVQQKWKTKFEFVSGNINDTPKLLECLNEIENLIWLVHTSVPSTSMYDVELDLISNITPLIRFFK